MKRAGMILSPEGAKEKMTWARNMGGGTQLSSSSRWYWKPAVKLAIELLDRDEREEIRFALADLPQHVEKFGFIIGVQRRTFRDQDPVNIEASELIARLHDAPR